MLCGLSCLAAGVMISSLSDPVPEIPEGADILRGANLYMLYDYDYKGSQPQDYTIGRDREFYCQVPGAIQVRHWAMCMKAVNLTLNRTSVCPYALYNSACSSCVCMTRNFACHCIPIHAIATWRSLHCTRHAHSVRSYQSKETP